MSAAVESFHLMGKDVQVQVSSSKPEHYDECNALVLQPKSKTDQKPTEQVSKQKTKFISKKRRKELEKIIERKKKKENRSNLYAALAEVQASDEVLNQLTSITTVHTIGVKQLLINKEHGTEHTSLGKGSNVLLNSIKGSKGNHQFNKLSKSELLKQSKDPSIVGFQDSSGETSDNTDDDDCTSGEDSDGNEEPSGDKTGVKTPETPKNYENKSEIKIDGKNEIQPLQNGSVGVTNSSKRFSVNSNWIVAENIINTTKNVSVNSKWKVAENVTNDNRKMNVYPQWKVAENLKNDRRSIACVNLNWKVDENITNNSKRLSTNPDWIVDENGTESLDKPDNICSDSLLNSSDEQNSKIVTANNTNNSINTKNPLKRKSETSEPAQKKVKKIKRKPAIFVPVSRKTEIQEARLKLPILMEEQVIMEAINENPIIILSGETGSGKTTQVPQFLYEAGYTLNGRMVGVTEPRRVAAISMSRRVAEELNVSSKEVSYLIRFEGNVTPETQIKFMTDGVLLKEIQTDFLLKKYSVIIIDEAHERSVYTDILIGLLSRIVPLRNKKGDPLKLIIMSATLRLNDFTDNKQLFKTTPPVIKVESRQYPVTIHFNKRTDRDYIREAYRKACKIHTQLPEGGILIFVTGQQEVNVLVRRFRNAFPIHKVKSRGNAADDEEERIEKALESSVRKGRKSRRKDLPVALPRIDLSNYGIANDDTEGDILDELDSDEDLDDEDADLGPPVTAQPMWVLPLYSLLPGHEQAKVFKPPPEGCRLCIVATNVAETSLTIPNVKYVVDSGKMKTKVYDKHTGISAFTVTWASKAAANQRAGRAGRTGPGHCYRLYASAVYNDMFALWSEPEIRRRPVDDLLLQLKAMGIERVVNFPFPSPPDIVQLKAAERRLVLLGALAPTIPLQSILLNNNKNSGDNSKLTKLGESMSAFPIAPRFGKMLLLSDQQPGLMEYVVALVAALSVQELLLVGDQRWNKSRRNSVGTGNSLLLGDMMVLLKAVGSAEYAHSNGNLEKYCTENGVRMKAVIEVRKLRIQLTNELKLNIKGLDLIVNPKMKPPTDLQARQLRQIVLAGMVDQVAARVSEEEALAAGVRKGKAAYQIMGTDQFVFIHSSCALYKEQPQWITYQQVTDSGSKMSLRGVTAVDPDWLPVFAPTLCNLTPEKEPPPHFNQEKGIPYCYVSGSFGPNGWHLPTVEVEFPQCLDCFRWFAVFLLDGSVFPKLSKYKSSLLSAPASMVKSWAKVVTRTQVLLKALADKQIGSKRDLLHEWTKNSKYLLPEYLQWIPEAGQNEVTLLWPPVEEGELDISVSSKEDEN